WQSACTAILDQAPSLRIFRARHRPVSLTRMRDAGPPDTIPLAALAGAPVVAFAGLARPWTFKNTLEQLGARVAGFVAFKDHHRFSPAQIQHCVTLARQSGAAFLVTTAKDAVRLDPRSIPPGLHVLHVEAAIDDFQELGRFILRQCEESQRSHGRPPVDRP
ncbi:MAG: tetraacyldisaccharide 4'-kinase, partial [Acidobacteriota bacterium]